MATPLALSSAAAGPRPSVKHPLMGARLSTLLGAWAEHGPVARSHAGLFTLMLLSALARAPFRLMDAAWAAVRRRVGPQPEAPLFIIGHWRTGTTHLHNLMGCSPAYGHITPIVSGLPNECLTLARWFRPLLEKALPEDRHVDRVAVTPVSPQEDEIPLASMQRLSVFHAVYFPRHFQRTVDRGVFFDGVDDAAVAQWARLAKRFADTVALQQRARRLVIKNPVYTARIAHLRTIWPEAPFVHIRRNPYEVFVSTRHYYRKLLPELALQPFDHVDIEAFVLDTFTRLMAAYEAQRAAVPAGRLIEVAYERLLRDPFAVLSEIHDRLGLPGWIEMQPRLLAYLDSIAGYRTNPYSITAADRAKVDAHWPDAVAAWEAMAR